MFSDKRFGLSSSLIAATRGVLAEAEDKEDKDKSDPKMMKGGKTKVDLEPKTDDDVREADVDKKKSVKEGKEHTVPKTDKEKKLASLAHPKDKITHKDVLVGRGVIAKEEAVTEAKHVFHVHMKADDTRSHKMIDDKTSEPVGNKPKGQKLVMKVTAVDSREARNKVSKHISKNYGVHAFKSIEYKGLDEEVEEMEEASMFSSKVKQGKGAAADIGSARYDFGKNAAPRRPDDTGKNVLSRRVFVKGAKPKGKLPEEVELSAEELARIEAIAQSLDEINMNAVMDRAERKAGAAQYKELMKKKAADGDEAAKRWLNPSLRLDKSSPTKPATNEEVEELDENWSKGASRSYLTDRINAGKSLNNAASRIRSSGGGGVNTSN